MSRELSESEYIEALISDFGLKKSDTIDKLLKTVIEDEIVAEEEDMTD